MLINPSFSKENCEMGIIQSSSGLIGKNSEPLPATSSFCEVSSWSVLRFKEMLVEELERVFHKFDTDGDGKVTVEELGAIFASLCNPPVSDDELRTLVNYDADSDGCGFINLAELITLTIDSVDEHAVMNDLRKAFSVFDVDGNGLISVEELHEALRRLGKDASLEQCRKIVKEVDCNDDGFISFEEFIIMLGSSPKSLDRY